MRRPLLAIFFSITLLSVSTRSGAQVLINYWNFNNFTAVDTFGSAFNPIPLIDADYSAINTKNAYIQYAFDSGTSVKSEDSCWIDETTGSTVNAQQGAAAGNCLRVRNPTDFTALEFFIPTTNFKNITVSYALQSSSAKSGQAVEAFAYSVDSGVTWKTANLTVNGAGVDTLLDTPSVYISGFGLVTIGFGSDTTVNNNSKLVFRITFKSYGTGAITGTSGNARLDNIAVMGSYIYSAIVISSPPSADTLYVGQQIPIIYQIFGGVSSTRTVNLSTDSGKTWTELGLSTTDTFTWVVANKASSNCFIEVNDTVNGLVGISPRFVIHAPKIVVSAPAAGISLYGGQQQTISYLPSGAISATRTIYLSTDSGVTWKQIVSTTQTSYTWTAPNANSNNCFIEIVDSNGITGESGRFSLRPPTITISQPNAGQTLISATSVLISYLTFGGVTGFRAIHFSSDSGKTWAQITISTADTFTWTIPSINSNNCFIEVIDQNGFIGKSGRFAISMTAPPPPPTSELIQYWNFNNLATTTTYKVPNVPHIDADYSLLDTSKAFLEYYLEPGTSSSYGSANGSDNLDGVASADTSNLRLGASSGDGLRVRNPVDSIQLRWHIPSTGYNNLVIKFAVESSSTGSGDSTQIYSYSTDAGVTWKSASITVNGANVDTMNTTSNPLMQGTNWGLVTVTFGSDLTVNNNPNLIFRIIFSGNTHLLSGNNRFDDFTLDGSQGAPQPPPPPPPPIPDSITVSTPAAGDSLLSGTQTTISYTVTATTSKSRSIDYSTNGGTSWINITTNDTALAFNWMVPATPSSNALIRIKDSSGVVGVSRPFVILVPGTVDSVWLSSSPVIAGLPTNIRWTATGYLGNSYTINVFYDGVTPNFLTSGTAAETGDYIWMVPAAALDSVFVQITFASGSSKTSAPFNIVVPAGVSSETPAGGSFSVWPNPFQTQTKIQYQLASSLNVSFSVHDLLGREIETIQEGMQSVGEHEIVFDGSNLPAGVYRYELVVGSQRHQGDLVIIR